MSLRFFPTISKTRHRGFPRFFQTALKIKLKGFPRFFRTTSKTRHNGFPRFFQTTSKIKPKWFSRVFRTTSKTRHIGFPRFFQSILSNTYLKNQAPIIPKNLLQKENKRFPGSFKLFQNQNKWGAPRLRFL